MPPCILALILFLPEPYIEQAGMMRRAWRHAFRDNGRCSEGSQKTRRGKARNVACPGEGGELLVLRELPGKPRRPTSGQALLWSFSRCTEKRRGREMTPSPSHTGNISQGPLLGWEEGGWILYCRRAFLKKFFFISYLFVRDTH